MNITEIIGKMTIEEKISFCTGADFWHTKGMKRYGIPAVTMSDGPHGLRCQSGGETDMIGVHDSHPATCFPAAVTAGAAWDPALYAAEGEAIGREAIAAGVDVVLGPGCNIKRNPLCGRNFEYLSEDPYLAGKLAAAYTRGQQSAGVSSCLKHFAANNQEYKRQNGDSQVDERALREIYLAPFETAVKEAHPDTVMCAYNKVNGIHASDNRWLLTNVLREEWGFDGMVVTDWGALNDRIRAWQAGCDLNMPGGSKYMEAAALKAVRDGTLSEEDIDASVGRILRLARKADAGRKGREGMPCDFDVEAHDELAYRIAVQGAVLLKNEGGLLPAKAEEMVLIGSMAENFRCQGAGSSHINPTRFSSLRSALPEVPFCPCGDKDGKVTEAELDRAVQAAKGAKVAVVVAGLPDSHESEGFDRDDMSLPEGHNRLIEAVAEANPDTVVVLVGGSPMEIPWCDRVKAILYMGLPGQAGGRACADLLTGKENPGGKLTESWPLTYKDVISRETFGRKNVEYRESIYVGYRYYDKAGKQVRFPFGHGLSYTGFAYSDLKLEGRKVSVNVTNTGDRVGAEVVQLYVAPPEGGLHRPKKELKGFVRLKLEPGESKTAVFALDDRSFAVWDNGWKVPGGTYLVCLGSSGQDIRLTGEIEVPGERTPAPDWQKGSWYETLRGTPGREEWEKAVGHPVALPSEAKKGSFTMDNTCMEMKDSSLVMKLQYRATELMMSRHFGWRRDYRDPGFRMMMACAADCPLRAAVISSGGAFSYRVAASLLAMANGHFFKGIARLLHLTGQ